MSTFTFPVYISRQNLTVYLFEGRLGIKQQDLTFLVPETQSNDFLKWLCMSAPWLPLNWFGNSVYNYFTIMYTITRDNVFQVVKSKDSVLINVDNINKFLLENDYAEQFLAWNSF